MNYLAYFAHQLAPLIPFGLGYWYGRGNERDKQKRSQPKPSVHFQMIADDNASDTFERIRKAAARRR